VAVDRILQRLQSLVVRRFNKLMSARRVATRSRNSAESFMGFIYFKSIEPWLCNFST
jgi:hypothetical protein